MKRPKLLLAGFFSITLLLPVSLSAQMVPVMMADDRRDAFIADLAQLLAYEDERFSGELILVPDPFRFERILPTLAEEKAVVGDIPLADLLQRIGNEIQASITGFQEFGDRPFLATRDFGLLRNGQVLNLRVTGIPQDSIRIEIYSITRESFFIRHDEEELEVPLSSERQGIRRTNR